MENLSPLHISYSAGSCDGGIATAVSQLLDAQQQSGLFARWLTTEQNFAFTREKDLTELIDKLQPDLLHCHGLWRAHTRILASFSNLNRPYLVSPHGMLDPWAISRSPWKKWAAWNLWESKAFHTARCIHALCDEEAEAIKSHVSGVPIAVIPNGVKLPADKREDLPDPVWSKAIPANDKVLLFLGRFHTKKGIEPLITAWQSVSQEAANSGWWLIFVGYGDDGKLESQLTNFPIARCLAFSAVFGTKKKSVLANSSAFILPSFSEGLPMAALEAMSYRLPCLLSKACNLPEATSSNAALRADPEVSKLAKSLQELFRLSSQDRTHMGCNGFKLILDKYNWQNISSKFNRLYAWVQDDSLPAPGFVHF